MQKITTYLHFNGNAEAAMKFYKAVLGGDFSILSRFKDVPGGERIPVEDQEKIVHISLDLGNGLVLQATDMLESMGVKLTFGNTYHVCLHVDSEKDADRIFEGLSAKGKIEMPMNRTLWGAYFGMCRDKFEVQWMISYEIKK